MIIDAHHHFWRTAAQDQPWRSAAHAALERDFLPDDLEPELDAVGVDATVLMQSVDEPAENDRLAEYARHPRVAGVVGWLPIQDPERSLAELRRVSMAKLCGVRCLIAGDPLDWLLEPASLRFFESIAARDLSWDVVPITATQTRQVIRLGRAVPGLRIVIDHLGRPPLDSGGWSPWAENVAELAALPSVAMKVSVGIDALTAWSEWRAATLGRYVGHVVDQFGSDRLMLASNWPVVLLRAPYARAWTDLRDLLADRLPAAADQAAVLGRTASRVYRLPGTAEPGSPAPPAQRPARTTSPRTTDSPPRPGAQQEGMS